MEKIDYMLDIDRAHEQLDYEFRNIDRDSCGYHDSRQVDRYYKHYENPIKNEAKKEIDILIHDPKVKRYIELKSIMDRPYKFDLPK